MREKWKRMCGAFLAALLVMTLLPVTALGENETTYQDPDSQVVYTITGNTASATGGAVGSGVAGDIEILSVLPDGQSVTSIGPQAFLVNTDITSVKIPSSVTEIGEEAFSGTTKLTSVTFEDGGSSGTGTIGKRAFYKSGITRDLVIPGQFGTIGEEAFYYCTGLTYITMEDGVQHVRESAFRGWTESGYCGAT